MEGERRESLSRCWCRAGVSLVHPSFSHPPVRDTASPSARRDGYAEQTYVSVSKAQPSPQHRPHSGQEGETSALPWPQPPSKDPGVRLASPQLHGLGLSPSTQKQGDLCLSSKDISTTQASNKISSFFPFFFFCPEVTSTQTTFCSAHNQQLTANNQPAGSKANSFVFRSEPAISTQVGLFLPAPPAFAGKIPPPSYPQVTASSW